MSRLIMLPCVGYLRVYEPLSAFSEAERSRWAAYGNSAGRPGRADVLVAEYAEALRRVIALPPIVAPARESDQAYVRWADGSTYICPWQTRLRSWLALSQLRATARPPLGEVFAPAQAELAADEFARWSGENPAHRVYIQSSTWSLPPAWFVPFAPAERWLVLGPAAGRAAGRPASGPATASVARTLVYATTMAQARRRVARAIAAVRRGAGPSAQVVGAGGELEHVGRWLEEFHPHSLVELDYAGLVQLLDDDALRADQSVAEVSAAVAALAAGDTDLASTVYRRLRDRWRRLEAIEAGS